MRKGVIAAASAVLLLTAACSGTGQQTTAASGSGGSGTYGYKFAVVTHGAAGDTFWDVVKKGAEKAGADMGDTVTYQDSNGDPAKQSQLIDAAVNQKVDGIVVSMANPDALKASVEKAVALSVKLG
jgi:simple sugar transport system substrate-binding protein